MNSRLVVVVTPGPALVLVLVLDRYLPGPVPSQLMPQKLCKCFYLFISGLQVSGFLSEPDQFPDSGSAPRGETTESKHFSFNLILVTISLHSEQVFHCLMSAEQEGTSYIYWVLPVTSWKINISTVVLLHWTFGGPQIGSLALAYANTMLL